MIGRRWAIAAAVPLLACGGGSGRGDGSGTEGSASSSLSSTSSGSGGTTGTDASGSGSATLEAGTAAPSATSADSTDAIKFDMAPTPDLAAYQLAVGRLKAGEPAFLLIWRRGATLLVKLIAEAA